MFSSRCSNIPRAKKNAIVSRHQPLLLLHLRGCISQAQQGGKGRKGENETREGEIRQRVEKGTEAATGGEGVWSEYRMTARGSKRRVLISLSGGGVEEESPRHSFHLRFYCLPIVKTVYHCSRKVSPYLNYACKRRGKQREKRREGGRGERGEKTLNNLMSRVTESDGRSDCNGGRHELRRKSKKPFKHFFFFSPLFCANANYGTQLQPKIAFPSAICQN